MKLDDAVKLILERRNGIYAWDWEDVLAAQELVLRERPSAELKFTRENGWIMISDF